MAESIVIPVHMTLYVQGGGTYQLQGVTCTFQANAINVAKVTLAVGTNSEGEIVDLNIERDAKAQIVIQSTFGEEVSSTQPTTNGIQNLGSYGDYGRLIKDNKPFVLFEGTVADNSPANISFGKFSVTVTLFGRLNQLVSGTAQTSSLTPKSYMDVQVAYPFGQGEDDPGLIRVGEALSTAGFWPAVRGALQRVAAVGPSAGAISANSVTQTIFDNFGLDLNAKAINSLQGIDGQLDWHPSIAGVVPAMVYHFNEQLRANWFYGSFFNTIMQLGEQLSCCVIENGEGVAVVPHHPFWSRTDNYRHIYATTWSGFQWTNKGEPANWAGVVLVESTANENEQQGTGDGLVVGLGKIPTAEFGQVHVGPAPGFMSAPSNALRHGLSEEARSTGGGEALRQLFGDTYAKLMALDLNFSWRSCQVVCPFVRTDIGPLSAVEVHYPEVPEITGGSDTTGFGVYGTVQSVTIAIDATANTAQTIFNIGYVRSLNQQRGIVEALSLPHPFFTTNYTGARLDERLYDPTFTIGF